MTIQCEGCGQFIAYRDLANGRATFHQEMEIADEHGSIRELEYNLCPKCNGVEEKAA